MQITLTYKTLQRKGKRVRIQRKGKRVRIPYGAATVIDAKRIVSQDTLL